MANQSDIDNASEQIARIVNTAKEELVASLVGLGTQVADLNTFFDTLLSLDIEGTLKSKIQKATSVYANAHRSVLESTIDFADIDGRGLSIFARLNEELFDAAIVRNIASSIRTQVSQGLQAGLTAKQITEQVAQSSISTAQMETVVNTTLNTYSRMATNQMMDQAPSNTKYVYIGPVDDRTRIECLDMASAGELTLSQIQSRFGEAVLIDGGGFNCRHKWEIASTEGKGFNLQKQAEKKLDNA
tara:strand:+ start:439 stop:1170 length:732 start_codon:yes stop_codon:yes gene_type:complete